MPFTLINVDATYIRCMRILYHDMIHKDIEVYVDNFIIKSHEKLDHMMH